MVNFIMVVMRHALIVRCDELHILEIIAYVIMDFLRFPKKKYS